MIWKLRLMMRKSIRLNFALVLLTGIFIINFYIFLTLPPSHSDNMASGNVGQEPRFLERRQSVSHLQVPRKRLNKSNYTSDSVGADLGGLGDAREWRGGREGQGGDGRGAAWEDRDREGERDQPLELGEVHREESKALDAKSMEMDNIRKGGDGGEGEEKPPPPPPLLFPSRQEQRLNQAETKERRTWREKTDTEDQPREDAPGHQVERYVIPGQKTATQPPDWHKYALQDTQPQQVDKEKKGKNSHEKLTIVRNYAKPQVDALIKVLEEKGLMDLLPDQGLEENYWAFLRRHRQRRKPGIPLPAYRNYRAKTNWEWFYKGIRQHALYDPDSSVVQNLLKDLTTCKIIDVEEKAGGTQLKLIITFDNGGKALFKPMRFSRETETLPDHFYFADYERHIAEIAAFHLDRVLGYNRVPPVAGRLINITRDIKSLADNKLARTFFISPAGNICFHGTCSYYCDSSHPVCGHPDMMEGSLMAFLPQDIVADRLTWRNPWRRSYSKWKKAYWEHYSDLCDKISQRAPYNMGRRLLDIVDMSVLDFLMGNQDRHHYETFENFGNDTFLLHLDNGRGFGKQHEDDLTCLVPLIQCCRVRLSTLQRLARLHVGSQPLSLIMKMSLSSDQVSPVLIEPHLQALDRRLVKVLQEVQNCIHKGRPLTEVIPDDGVY